MAAIIVNALDYLFAVMVFRHLTENTTSQLNQVSLPIKSVSISKLLSCRSSFSQRNLYIYSCLTKQVICAREKHFSTPYSEKEYALGKSKSNIAFERVGLFFSKTIKYSGGKGVGKNNHETRNQCVDELLVLLNKTSGTVASVHCSPSEGFLFFFSFLLDKHLKEK